MALNEDYKTFILDQLSGFGEFEAKNQFGGVALMCEGVAFGKIKHDKVWLKADSTNVDDFVKHNMPQYTYGKDGSRKLNFYEAPLEIIEDRDKLVEWAKKSLQVAINPTK
ncbi:MAG: DNA transformation protein [Polaribacter sp.]|jgi:DNA transformation protein